MEGVREAVAADLERLEALTGALVAEVALQRGGDLALAEQVPSGGGADGPRDRSAVGDGGAVGAGVVAWRDLLADPERLVLAGTVDGVVVGFATGHVDQRGPAGRQGVLDGCYVEPEGRGVGVGRLLLDTAVAWFSRRGCRGIDGTALPGDRSAKNFFEAAGFKARLLTMHHDLAAGPDRGAGPAGG